MAGDEATYCTKPPGTSLAWACRGKQAALTPALPEFWNLDPGGGWGSWEGIPAAAQRHWEDGESAGGHRASCPRLGPPRAGRDRAPSLQKVRGSPMFLGAPSVTAKPLLLDRALRRRRRRSTLGVTFGAVTLHLAPAFRTANVLTTNGRSPGWPRGFRHRTDGAGPRRWATLRPPDSPQTASGKRNDLD